MRDADQVPSVGHIPLFPGRAPVDDRGTGRRWSVGTGCIRVLVSSFLGLGLASPVIAQGASPSAALVAIEEACVCNFYVADQDQNLGKFYVQFSYPHRIPRDIEFITVLGPSGFVFSFDQRLFTIFNLNGYIPSVVQPGWPFLTRYMGFQENPLESGDYLVVVVDRLGNLETRFRHFEDGSASFIPRVNSVDHDEFLPLDGQFGVSLTTTVSWGIVEAADYYYVLRINSGARSVFMDNIFLDKTGLNKSSLTVPEGVLEPFTTYNWNIEICDSDDLGQINNCALLPSFVFTTGP